MVVCRASISVRIAPPYIVPVNAPGVTTICHKVAVHEANPFVAPLSSRYDEPDGQMWFDDVFIP